MSPDELVEDLQAYLPPLLGLVREELPGAVVACSPYPDPTFSFATRLRDPDPDEVRDWFRAHGRADFTWWRGPSTRLDETPGEPFAHFAGMTLAEEPPSVAGVEVRRVESFEEYLLAQEVGWDAWESPPEQRRRERDAARERYAALTSTMFLAYVDGRPAGRGSVRALDGGAALTGGSVARWAQGRGAYRALVRARWEAAGGLPLVTQARPETSQPILERLGFRVACMLEVRREAL